MNSKAKINLNLSWLGLLVVAFALIEAWKLGVPWYVGLGVGLLAVVFAMLGVVPLFGQVVYCIGFRWLLVSKIGVWMAWTFWLGFVVSVVISVVIGLMLLVVLSR